ncbi:MAG: hypothetical protein U9Q30_06505 [Campylobacterota bacterium]|nr:hypothetical protein [Campylobacterota bacterium]
MQTFQLEVNDNISDKILWLLNSFKNDVKITKIDNTNSELNNITTSVKTALNEVKYAKDNNKELDNAWDLLDEL